MTERLGPLGGKLRAGRSRNDQSANDLRLYLRHQSSRLARGMLALQAALIGQAEANLAPIAACRDRKGTSLNPTHQCAAPMPCPACNKTKRTKIHENTASREEKNTPEHPK